MNPIVSLVAVVAASTIIPSLFAAECTASKTGSVTDCLSGGDIVVVTSGAGSFNALVAVMKAAGHR